LLQAATNGKSDLTNDLKTAKAQLPSSNGLVVQRVPLHEMTMDGNDDWTPIAARRAMWETRLATNS